jgi:DNA-binding CsgD family transcriptional regulator
VGHHRRRAALIFLFLFFAPLLCAAQLPPRPMAFPLYHAYFIFSIFVSGWASFRILAASLRAESRHLRWFTALAAINFLTLACLYFAQLSRKTFVYFDTASLGSTIGSCLTLFVLPWTVETHPGWRIKGSRWAFTALGALMGVHYLVSFIYFYAREWSPGMKYFSNMRLFPLLLLGLSLVSAILYYCAIAFLHGKTMPIGKEERRALAAMAIVCSTGGLLSALIDNFRWYVPLLWEPYPYLDYIITPATSIANCAVFIAYANAHARARVAPAETGEPEREHSFLAGLSDKEREVAILLAQGLAYKQVAYELSISMGTVQTHISHIYRKLGVNCKEELMNLRRPPIATAAARPARDE